jgi:hypothetical protein
MEIERNIPALSTVTGSDTVAVKVNAPPTSAGPDGDTPPGWREAVAKDREAAAAHRETRPAVSESRPLATPAPAQEAASEATAALAPAPKPVSPPAPEAAEDAPEASEPVVSFPPFVPAPVLLDLGEPPVQGRDENWQEYAARQARYQARATANEKSIADNNAAIERRNAEVRYIQEQELARVVTTWHDRKAAAIKERPDYLAVTESDSVAISETMATHIVTLPNGTDVAYHLGKHPAEARKIHDMSPLRQIDAVARLSERLSAKPAASAKASAPAQRAAPRVSAVDLNKMDMSEYASYRNQQIRDERRH